ncbi:DExH-box ATP-dependent RNA helicase DExH9 [Vitis vinifera]|uniref:DExH-box ATP-dependent RNA helicase DExH9 n=1 Tax=Vitis vinifera TaxID=29760 RepID=A0A438E2B1_VITVI|nr:DExH-box ATP-dependent RNA helicase DExH9 [Vitis vinifera]
MQVHQQPCHIVYTDYRPTPLQHYIFPSGGDGLYLVVDEKGKFREDSFQKALNALVPAGEGDKKRENGKRQKGLVVGRAGEESDIFKMVKMIIQRQYDPVILFSFSKRDCEFLAMQGGSFTWSGGLNNQSHSRLDRFLVSDEWEGHFTGADIVELTQPLTVLELEAKRGAKEDFKKWVLLEDISWRHKSREVWLREGNRNTEENEIRVGVVNAFKNLLFATGGWRPSISDLSFARLKLVVGKVVFKAQKAFVEGRQILDTVLVANEVINSILKSNERAVMCKLDIEKAYDRVDWGLRQGDPFSPYLFVIAMEDLSCLLKRAVNSVFLVACKARGRGGEGVQVSHLLFTDDTLVFYGASQDQMMYLSWILMWFEAISGLRINLDKSELILVGGVENAKALVADLGCKVGSLSSSSLRLPLGAPHRSVTV